VYGLELKEMSTPEQCCGFGGTFAVKFGEISTRICDQKCADIAATGANAVILGDLGCMLNIEGRMRRRGETTRVLHIAEVLAGMTDADGSGA
jgi:L-lactate dehydrogenase complex protein LldE